MKTKFLVFTDLHVDIMHDAVARMQLILKAAHEKGVDYLIHLGDVMYPEEAFVKQHAPDDWQRREYGWFVCDRDDEKQTIREMLMASGLKVYGVLGNHDMDSCDKRTACAYWEMPAPYYSFVEGGVRFVVLDSNFIHRGDLWQDFAYCNYRDYTAPEKQHLPPQQLAWLKQTLHSSPQPCVLLSHASLGAAKGHIQNNQDVWQIIEEANRDRRRVIAALNGHNHVDGLSIRRGVPFLCVNSASNIWIGMEYATTRYSESLCRHYPYLKGTAPYYDPLYAVVTIDDDGIHIEGTRSEFVGPSPQELGYLKTQPYHEASPCILSRELPLTFIEGEGKTGRFVVGDGDVRRGSASPDTLSAQGLCP